MSQPMSSKPTHLQLCVNVTNVVVVVVSGMQLRLRSAIRRHHPPQRGVLSQICCLWERTVMVFQILLNGP